MKINKILIANRGEIAVRIIRTAQRLGIITVAVYSEVDKDSLHVELADEAFCLGHSTLTDTYLNAGKMVNIALDAHCDAIHPGYGFLSENASFVAACSAAGLAFIGPDARAMQVMGNKIEARTFVESIGVPITRGISGTPQYILDHSDNLGFPLLVKAAAGGGGKGMRIVGSKDQLAEALESTSREAANYFADGTVYVEKFIENPRHIEIQLLGDNHGNVIHLFERECSIQRRYQKIIEEAPSPTLTPEVREKMGEAAVAIGKAIGYSGAGTIEFLVDKDLNFYFLEMNTRIQVEHPVTEMTTGIDIVEEQFRIASGEQLRFVQSDLSQQGHSIECRIYAEDPANGFLPSPGKMTLYREPSGESVRVDSGIAGNPVIQPFFDPMIAKLIVHGSSRDVARQRMMDALQHYIIHGVRNNVSFLLALLGHKAFIDNLISTKYCDDHLQEILAEMQEKYSSIDLQIPLIAVLIFSLQNKTPKNDSIWEQIGYWRIMMNPVMQIGETSFPFRLHEFSPHNLKLVIEGEPAEISYHLFPAGKLEFAFKGRHFLTWVSTLETGKFLVTFQGMEYEVLRVDSLPPQLEFSGSESVAASNIGNIVSPMPGRVIKINVAEGQEVMKGDVLLVVEAMKMENAIICPGDGVVDKIEVGLGDLVDSSSRLIHVSEKEK